MKPVSPKDKQAWVDARMMEALTFDRDQPRASGPGTGWEDAQAKDPAKSIADMERRRERMKQIRDLAAKDTKKPGQPAKDDRGFHAKGHAAGVGTFIVSNDIPNEYRYGVFAEGGAHDIDYRLSNGLLAWAKNAPDIIPDVRGFAFKVFRYQDGDMWTGERACTQDFNGTDVRPFARTGGQFVAFAEATATFFTTLVHWAKQGVAFVGPSAGRVPKGIAGAVGAFIGAIVGTGKMLASYLKNEDVAPTLGGRLIETPRMLGTVALGTALPLTSLAAREYEVGSFQVGPRMVRMIIAPSEETKKNLIHSHKFLERNYLRENWIENRKKGPITFDVFLVPFDPKQDTVNDAHLAPVGERIKVGKLEIPQLVDEAADQAIEARVEKDAFQPWHTFKDNRRDELPSSAVEERRAQGHIPRGSIQNERFGVYLDSAADRGANDEPSLEALSSRSAA